MSEFSIQSMTGGKESLLLRLWKILSMLKNHLNNVSYAKSMPPICDGWFLTDKKIVKEINRDGIKLI